MLQNMAAVVRKFALMAVAAICVAGYSVGDVSAQTACSGTPMTSNGFVQTQLSTGLLSSGQCSVTRASIAIEDLLAILVREPSFPSNTAGRAVFYAASGGVLVKPDSLLVDGVPATVLAGNQLRSDVLSIGTHTAIGRATLNGIIYKVEMVFEFTATQVTVTSAVITGGAFGGLVERVVPSTDPDPAEIARRQSTANKLAGAAFGRASNSAQTFATQTQSQSRLLDDNEDQGNGDGAGGSAALATAYGETVHRPGEKTTWHSKDLFKHYRSQ